MGNHVYVEEGCSRCCIALGCTADVKSRISVLAIKREPMNPTEALRRGFGRHSQTIKRGSIDVAALELNTGDIQSRSSRKTYVK